MPKATVYYFEKYDLEKHLMMRAGPATIQAIAKAKGKTLKKTMQEVDDSRVDADGFLIAT
jgi:hypothetical protein